MTTDGSIHTRITELVTQERELRAKLQEHEIAPEEERAQLRDLEVQLDQCWDLLRQRQALRDAGADPTDASVRPPDEVEGYLN